jgi:hypothetical protein
VVGNPDVGPGGTYHNSGWLCMFQVLMYLHRHSDCHYILHDYGGRVWALRHMSPHTVEQYENSRRANFLPKRIEDLLGPQ